MDEYPAKAFTQKRNASIPLGFAHLKYGRYLDGFASAGNTGAMLVGAMQVVKSIPGVLRPCITASLPKESGKHTLLLDVGINPDCKPDVLYQYAILGSLYVEMVFGVKKPRVALFNIGSEEEKGESSDKGQAIRLMKDTSDFNFIGNAEGTDLFRDDIDVIVCDGFVGNTILKTIEAFYKCFLTSKISKTIISKDSTTKSMEVHRFSELMLLAIIGHGISGPNAIKNMIIHTAHVVESRLTDKIKQAFQ